ncbi:DUF7310 family coiled-coil domain-containing protein [Halodesulfurarchaeum sp.]|uniref:DUF7310 family coiled-coil domain-containing protein n=1 Tax=Halodesulfurarchaeum sp. TaxID=1980530 RepID=UPI001BB9C9B6|nr:hypothetical protein [Halodesulfurarchaeum sp.]
MPERRSIDERVGALERRLSAEPADTAKTTGSEPPAGESGTRSDHADLRDRIETLESTVAELEAGLKAVRGYVGTVEHVNETVERRADAALAAVERLESAPKTPPPIATAKQQSAESASTATAEPDEDAETQPESSLIDRLRSLR